MGELRSQRVPSTSGSATRCAGWFGALALLSCGGLGSVGDAGVDAQADGGVSLTSCPLVGAPPERVANLEDEVVALLATGGFVYYGHAGISAPRPELYDHALRRIPRNGGGSEIVSTDYWDGEIATDGQRLYFPKGVAIWLGSSWSFETPAIEALPIGGGSAVTLPQAPTARQASHPGVGTPDGVLWTVELPPPDGGAIPWGVARWDGQKTTLPVTDSSWSWGADATTIFFIQWRFPDGSTLMSTPIAGGSPVLLADIPGDEYAIAGMDDSNLYLVGLHGSGILRMLKSGASRTVLVPALPTSDAFGSVLVDGGWVYFVDMRAAKLQRVPTSGGPIEIVADENGDGIGTMAADDCAIYWTAGVPPRLMRRAK